MRPRVSKKTYIGLMAGGLVLAIVFIFLGVVAIIAAAAASQGSSDDTAGAVAAAGFGFMLFLGIACAMVPMIAFLVLLYKAWTAINDGQARTTPGMAVGFMFIPLFNLYWMFMAIYGWAQDYNKYIARYRLQVQPMPEGLFLMMPIFQLVFYPAALVMLFLVTSKMCDGINAIADAPQQAMPAPVAVG